MRKIKLDKFKNKNIYLAIALILFLFLLLFFINGFSGFNNLKKEHNDNINSNFATAYLSLDEDEDEDEKDITPFENKIITINDNNNINFLYGYYLDKISNGDFVMIKELDKTFAEVIHHHNNPAIFVSFSLKNINSCKDYPHVVNSLIAETMRKPLKPYILTLNNDDIIKLNNLVRKCQ